MSSVNGGPSISAQPNTQAVMEAPGTDVPDGLADPTASVALTPVAGVSTAAMRADAAPALDQGIAPVWTGAHQFDGDVGFGGEAPIAPPTVTGDTEGNAALESLIAALASYGLIVDGT